MITTYQEAREYLEGFIHAKLYQNVIAGSNDQSDHLARMAYLLNLLGNPQHAFPLVIVSGTSGKGSTAYLMARMLAAAGHKTGFTLSPHLQKINERIQISSGEDLVQISDKAFIGLLNRIRPVIESMTDSRFGLPTYYEILAAMVFMRFKEQQVDIAVVEVGLESKFEATNLMYPLIFILTNISLDHVAILGDTVEKIADEATHRIKDLRPSKPGGKQPLVITGATQPSVLRFIADRAAASESRVLQLGRDFTIADASQSDEGVVFNFSNEGNRFNQIRLSLLGMYQASNAALAIETMLQLKYFGFTVDERAMRRALASASFPGRFEVRTLDDTTYVIDGAHNQAKMQAFCTSLHELYKNEKKVFLIAFKKDKDVDELLRLIDQEADAIVLTRFVSSVDLGKNLGMEMEELRTHVAGAGLKTKELAFEPDGGSALTYAHDLATQMSAIVVVTGSMYLIGEMSTLLDERGAATPNP
jgi:dihydrofolate synthase/folylpolyglutamate synthase